MLYVRTVERSTSIYRTCSHALMQKPTAMMLNTTPKITSLQIRQRRDEFRTALQQRNPTRGAELLSLPPIADTPHNNRETLLNQLKSALSNGSIDLVENTASNGSSVDWSNVLKHWFSASYAAQLVSVTKQGTQINSP